MGPLLLLLLTPHVYIANRVEVLPNIQEPTSQIFGYSPVTYIENLLSWYKFFSAFTFIATIIIFFHVSFLFTTIYRNYVSVYIVLKDFLYFITIFI